MKWNQVWEKVNHQMLERQYLDLNNPGTPENGCEVICGAPTTLAANGSVKGERWWTLGTRKVVRKWERKTFKTKGCRHTLVGPNWRQLVEHSLSWQHVNPETTFVWRDKEHCLHHLDDWRVSTYQSLWELWRLGPQTCVDYGIVICILSLSLSLSLSVVVVATDVALVELIYFAVACIPSDSYRGSFKSPLCPLFYVWRHSSVVNPFCKNSQLRPFQKR